MSRKLTPKQARFIEEYLVDLNATQAAIRAGYSAKTARQVAHKLLTNADISAGIQAGRDKLSKQTGITAERVIQEVSKVAFANIHDVLKWGPSGVVVLDSMDLPDDVTAAVAEVSDVLTAQGRTIKVKMHSKEAALDKLMRHFGLYEKDNEQLNPADALARLIDTIQGRSMPKPAEIAGGDDSR